MCFDYAADPSDPASCELCDLRVSLSLPPDLESEPARTVGG